MPWKETCHMGERTQFMARILNGEDEMAALCREYGISRKTGYKWLGRHRCEGAAGLREQHTLRRGTARLMLSVMQAVLSLRERRRQRREQACGSDGDRCRDPHNLTGPSTATSLRLNGS